MFIIIEIQKDANGQLGTLVTSYEQQNAAESSFYTILAAAALSSLPKHGAVLMTDDGIVLRSECYNRT